MHSIHWALAALLIFSAPALAISPVHSNPPHAATPSNPAAGDAGAARELDRRALSGSLVLKAGSSGSFGSSYFGFPGIDGPARSARLLGSGVPSSGHGSRKYELGGCGDRYFGFEQFGGGGSAGYQVTSRRGGNKGCGR